MKLNWGHGITIAIILFMSFIVYIVIQTFQLNADLVQDDYYEQEVLFDKKRVLIQNYKSLPNNITITQEADGINLKFPDEIISPFGSILFYRRDDKRLDKKFEIAVDEQNIQIIPYEQFLIGKYDIKIEFNSQNKMYLHQSSILF